MTGEGGNELPRPNIKDSGKENPHEVFERTLETTRQVMDGLVGFATQNGINPIRFSHIPKVFGGEGHILLPPIAVMRRELANAHGESDLNSRTRALTARKTGEVFVPEEQAGSLHDVLHESIHRAAWLRDRELGLNTNTTNIANQLADGFGVSIDASGGIDPQSEYIQRFSETDEDRAHLIKYFTETLRTFTPRVTEGLVEWATQRADGIAKNSGIVIDMNEEDNVYDYEIQKLNKVRIQLMEDEKLTANQVDAKLITAALTGDISDLMPYLSSFI